MGKWDVKSQFIKSKSKQIIFSKIIFLITLSEFTTDFPFHSVGKFCKSLPIDDEYYEKDFFFKCLYG